MISAETAADYFRNHLSGEIFFESQPETRSSALAMAELDIISQLDSPPDPRERCFIAAVCEQAVFLLCHRERLTERQVLLSETVEGLGSRSYSACNDERSLVLAPRAGLYLKHLASGRRLPLKRG